VIFTHTNFSILNIECSFHMLLILDRNFIATCNACINYKIGILDISFGNMLKRFLFFSENLNSHDDTIKYLKYFNASSLISSYLDKEHVNSITNSLHLPKDTFIDKFFLIFNLLIYLIMIIILHSLMILINFIILIYVIYLLSYFHSSIFHMGHLNSSLYNSLVFN